MEIQSVTCNAILSAVHGRSNGLLITEGAAVQNMFECFFTVVGNTEKMLQ
jgi:hypothetical protein